MTKMDSLSAVILKLPIDMDGKAWSIATPVNGAVCINARAAQKGL